MHYIDVLEIPAVAGITGEEKRQAAYFGTHNVKCGDKSKKSNEAVDKFEEVLRRERSKREGKN